MGGAEFSTSSDDPEQGLVLVDGAIALMIDVRVYRLTAVKKAAYRMADRCTAMIGALADPLIPVTLRFKPGTSESRSPRRSPAVFSGAARPGAARADRRRDQRRAHPDPRPRVLEG